MTELVANFKELLVEVRKLESENRKLNRMIARLESKAEKPVRATRTVKKTKMGARKVKVAKVTKKVGAKKVATKSTKVSPKRSNKVSSRKVESFEL